jgi:antitoxin CptB
LNQPESSNPQLDTPAIKKLQWQCRRGMLELDVILIPFLNEHFEELTGDLKEVFTQLLKESDPDLYTWIMGFGKCKNNDFKDIIQIIREKMSVA